MKQEYEIHIGEIYDRNHGHKPEQVLVISEDQFQLIEQFASTRVDLMLRKWYRLNDVEFRIYPHIKMQA